MRFRNVSLALAGALLVGLAAPPADAVRVPAPLAPKVVVTPGLAKQFAGDLTRVSEASVHFRAGDAAQRQALLTNAGLTTLADLAMIDTVFVSGPLANIKSLKASSLVDHLQDNTPLEYYDDTAEWATRSRVLQNPVSGGKFRAASGAVLDGTGIGIAIVDSGVDGSHPDLAGRMASNTRYVCGIVVTTTNPPNGCFPPQGALRLPPASNSDLLSGHGTFVAGMAAGDGTASNGLYTGTAPGAKIHGFGAGATLFNFFAANALADLHKNFNTFSPKIRVVNNSYGGAGAYDPTDPVSMLANRLVADHDMVVTFAAGNDGGDGSSPTGLTSSYCRNPTPGVICVANYDDANTGNRNNVLDTGSSRGIAADASQKSWPDLSAPGAFVTAPCARTSAPLCSAAGLITPTVDWEPYYGNGSGTSFSAPMVAGAVAIIRQANPLLNAAQVEDVVKDTAYKFATAGPYSPDVNEAGQTTSFDKGRGLLDLVAIANDSRVSGVGDGAVAAPTTLFSGDGGDVLVGASDIVSGTATPGATGVVYTITVRDADDRLPVTNPTLRVTQIINGKNYLSDVILTTTLTGAIPGAGPSAPTSASRTGNVVTFEVPYSRLGNPAVGDSAHNVFASSFAGLIVDAAPGPQPGLPIDALLRPTRTQYTVR